MLSSAQRVGTSDDADGLAAVGGAGAAGAAELRGTFGVLATTKAAAAAEGNDPPKAGTAGATVETAVA